MPLTSGTRLGAYEITHVLGAGGMGQVYRARDARLGRDVAIKVILDSFASDVDRVARFEREAKVLAAINHPNIAVLFGLEEAANQHFLVMELVEGETLAERLTRGRLEIEDALGIARQIAEALEAAHDKNIVHRDLKPANVKITPDGKVKVLDFGLAKAMQASSDRDIANSPTLSMMATSAGVILGTAAYMSPEQAKGLAADHRSDVFSFGVVLFEMLTGRQPFQGETAPDVLASVLVREPELQRLPPDLSPRVTELLRRCLEKNPKRRWQAVGDLRAEIEAVAATPRVAVSQVSGGGPWKLSWRQVIPVAFAAVLAAGLGAIAAWQLKPASARDVVRFSVRPDDDQALTGVLRRTIDVSPDGSQLVFSSGGVLHLRPLSSATASPIQATTTFQNAVSPSFSPDGQHVAFYATSDRTIKRTALTGGAATTVCGIPGPPVSIAWFGDSILFTQADGVMRVAAAGGTAEKIVSVGAQERVQRVQMLPDGETVLFTVGVSAGSETVRWDAAQIVAQSLKTQSRKTVVNGGSDGWYVPTGHLVYAIGGTLYADEFDLRKLDVKGAAIPIVEGVRRAPFSAGGIAWFGISNTGTLAYVPGPAMTIELGADIGLIRRNGTSFQNPSPLKLPPAPYLHPRVSGDGKRIAVERNDGQEAVILIHDLLGSRAPWRLPAPGRNRYPIWHPDGSRVVFQSDGGGDLGIFSQTVERAGTAERLTTASAGESHVPESWHPRGDILLYSVVKGSEHALWTYSSRERTVRPFAGIRSVIPLDAVFSPDGKWIAYSSAATANDLATIYVQPYPPTGERHQIERTLSSDQPHHPVWASQGSELIFNHRAGLVSAVSVTTAPTFRFGNPVNAPRRFQTGAPSQRRTFDIMGDGRLVGIIAAGGDPSAFDDAQINVVMNWFEELKARTSARR